MTDATIFKECMYYFPSFLPPAISGGGGGLLDAPCSCIRVFRSSESIGRVFFHFYHAFLSILPQPKTHILIFQIKFPKILKCVHGSDSNIFFHFHCACNHTYATKTHILIFPQIQYGCNHR